MFNPNDPLGLLIGYSLALVFVLFVTGAWRKSYSATLSILADVVIVQLWLSESCMRGVLVMHILNTLLLVRAIIHDNRDYVVRWRRNAKLN